MSQQVNLDLQAEEEDRAKLRQARMERANRAAAAANAAIKVCQQIRNLAGEHSWNASSRSCGVLGICDMCI